MQDDRFARKVAYRNNFFFNDTKYVMVDKTVTGCSILKSVNHYNEVFNQCLITVLLLKYFLGVLTRYTL